MVKKASTTDRLKSRASETAVAGAIDRVMEIPLNKIRFDPTQPRKAFHHLDGQVALEDEQYIDELAASIKDKKLIHAITVQEMSDGTYMVVVGECRTRAHLKLGLPTIRAVLRNDLDDPAERLLFQLAENVNRSDLSDFELAQSICKLIAGDDTTPPMKQVQVAAAMGKSEGWVTRFVKFSDAELQRVWVESGIADTVEKVYRLSSLPTAVQLDIQRRIALPPGDTDRLEKPLIRDVIDKLARDAKAEKRRSSDSVSPRQGTSYAEVANNAGKTDTEAPLIFTSPQNALNADVSSNTTRNGIASDDLIGQAFSEAAADAAAGRLTSSRYNAIQEGTGEYQLSPEARAKILGSARFETQTTDGETVGEVVPAPVNCRVSVQNILAMANAFKDFPDISKLIPGVWCDLSLSGPLAKIIANQLMGVVVADRELHAVLQTELTKLQ